MKVDLWPVNGILPPTKRRSRWRQFLERHLSSVVIYLMVATLVAVVLYPHMVITIPSGEVGVLWKRFGGGTVLDPINRKIEQYYIAEEYKFRIEREKRESERKKIEAEGIRDFQQTVSQGISDSYLRWRGVEATLQLSQSTNAKTVIIGNGKDGLPLILGNGDAPAQPAGSKTPDGTDKKERTTATSPALEKTTSPASLTPERPVAEQPQ